MSAKIDISPEQLDIVQAILRAHLPKGTRAWAFGSRVTWTAKPYSDLDLAVEAAAPLPLEVMGDLQEAFENSDLPWRVDVIDLKSVSPEFRAIVERQRVPITLTQNHLKLDDVATLFSGGTPSKSNKEYWGGPYPWLTPKDMNQFNGATEDSVNEKAIGNGTRLASADSLFIAVRGMSLHNEIRIVRPRRPMTFNQDIKAVTPKTGTDPIFLFYALLNEVPRLLASVHAAGHGTGVLSTDLLRLTPIPDFPLSYQAHLGKALSALDDKIELNRQMNQTLEALARAVFEDWFVAFGPTRRKMAGETDPAAILGGLLPPETAAPLAPLFPDQFGETGLPIGWEMRTINDDFSVEMGQSPPGSTYNETGDGLPFFQGRRDFQFRFPEKRVYCSAPTRIAEADWTLISVRAPVGDINRAWEKCCIGRGVGGMMHKRGLASYTYYVGLHLQAELASYDKDGTVFGSINQKQIKGLAVTASNSKAAQAFDALIGPMDDQIRTATLENQTLAATRDLLLPKLMSGELRLLDGGGGV